MPEEITWNSNKSLGLKIIFCASTRLENKRFSPYWIGCTGIVLSGNEATRTLPWLTNVNNTLWLAGSAIVERLRTVLHHSFSRSSWHRNNAVSALTVCPRVASADSVEKYWPLQYGDHVGSVPIRRRSTHAHSSLNKGVVPRNYDKTIPCVIHLYQIIYAYGFKIA